METASPITIGQKKQLMRLLNYDEQVKEEVVIAITRQPHKHSLSDLSFADANNLIDKLGGKPAVDYDWAHFDKFNKQHSYLLSLCIQVGWSTLHARYGYVADLRRLSDFLKSDRSPVKKPLKAMTAAELSKIIYALEQIMKFKYR